MTDDERKTERIQVLMTPSEVSALDDWAFANRIRSRGEAIRRLIEAGLSGQLVQKPDEASGKQPQAQGKGLPPTTLGGRSPQQSHDQAAEASSPKAAQPRKSVPRARRERDTQ